MSLGNRVGPVAIALAAMLVTGLLSACSSSPQPQTTSNAYFAAWAKQDWAAMQQLVSQPPADFTAVNQAAFTNLGVHQASFAPGTMVTSGSTATEPFTARLALAGVGTITIKSTLHLAQVQGHWLVNWTPATIAPAAEGRRAAFATRDLAGPRGHPRRGRGTLGNYGPGGHDRRGGRPDQGRQGGPGGAGRGRGAT